MKVCSLVTVRAFRNSGIHYDAFALIIFISLARCVCVCVSGNDPHSMAQKANESTGRTDRIGVAISFVNYRLGGSDRENRRRRRRLSTAF